MALGRSLTAEMEGHDTLGRWMAYYIADLIEQAACAPEGPRRDETRRECATEILRLWSHRRTFNWHDRPMASFDLIYQAIERIAADQPRLYGYGLPAGLAHGENASEIDKLVKAAVAVDSAARSAQRELILAAVRLAAQQEATWLELADDLEDDDLGVSRKLRRMADNSKGTIGEAIESLIKVARSAAITATPNRHSDNRTEPE